MTEPIGSLALYLINLRRSCFLVSCFKLNVCSTFTPVGFCLNIIFLSWRNCQLWCFPFLFLEFWSEQKRNGSAGWLHLTVYICTISTVCILKYMLLLLVAVPNIFVQSARILLLHVWVLQISIPRPCLSSSNTWWHMVQLKILVLTECTSLHSMRRIAVSLI